MKNINHSDAEAARELFDEIQTKFNELKDFIRSHLESHERDDFKYNCLSRCEPGLFEEHDWMTQYDGIISMEKWVERMEEEAGADEEEEDESSDDNDGYTDSVLPPKPKQ